MSAELPYSTDELLAHQSWVRGLALHLVRESAAADDLVQDTWLLALERPPGRQTPLGPWLARVVANLARHRRRGDARRRQRERASVSRASAPTPDELLARVELQQELVRLVVALAEPYRTTLLLHYFEELPATEIATREQIAAATVRQRLKRGREQLRAALDEQHGGDRDAWSTALLAFARPSTTPRSSSMTKFLLYVTSAAGITALVWIVPQMRTAPLSPPANTVAMTTAAAEPPGALTAPSERRVADAAVIGEPLSQTALVVHVRHADGSPAAGEWVRIVPDTPPHPFADEIGRSTDERGDAVFTSLTAGRVGIELQHRGDDLDWIDVDAGGTARVTLDLPSGYTIRGEVVDAHGAPVPGASVWVGEPWSRLVGHVLATSDGSGHFELGGLQADGMHWFGAFSPGRAPSSVTYVDASPGEVVASRIVLDRDGGRVRGRVVDRAGKPIPGAQVLVGFESSEWASSPHGSPPRRARADDDGSFTIDSVPCGTSPVYARSPGYAVGTAEVEVASDRESSVRLTLEPEARVVGLASLDGDRGGARIVGAKIARLDATPFAAPSTTSDRHGGFELVGLAGHVRIAARAESGSDEIELTLEPGEKHKWNPALRPAATVRGRVLDAHRLPLAGRELKLVEESAFRRDTRYATTDASGAFAFGEARDVDHVLMLAAETPSFPILVVRGVRPSQKPLELSLKDLATTRGSIAGSVFDPSGSPLAAAQLCIHHVEQNVDDSIVVASDGQFEVALPAGTLELSASAEGQPWLDFERIVLAAGEHVDVGSRRFARAGSVQGALRGVPEAALSTLRIRWRDAAGRELAGELHTTSEYRSPPLAPGRCTLRVQGDGVESTEQTFELDEGASLQRDIELHPAPMRAVELVLPDGEPRPGEFRARVRDEKQQVRWQLDSTFAPAGALAFDVSAAPGRYRIEVEVDTGLSAKGEFVMERAGGVPLLLELSRR